MKFYLEIQSKSENMTTKVLHVKTGLHVQINFV